MGEINFKLNWESLSTKPYDGILMNEKIFCTVYYNNEPNPKYGGRFCLAKNTCNGYRYFNTLNGKWVCNATNCWRKDFAKLLEDAKKHMGSFVFKFSPSAVLVL